MAEEQPVDSGYADRENGRIRTMDELARKVDWLIDKLSGGGPGKAEPASEKDDAATVEERVRSELARARQEEERRQAADAEKSEREELRETVRKLQEQPPAPAARRSTKLMWGGQ